MVQIDIDAGEVVMDIHVVARDFSATRAYDTHTVTASTERFHELHLGMYQSCVLWSDKYLVR